MEAYFPQTTRDALAGLLPSQMSGRFPEMPAYLTQDVLLRAAGAVGAIYAIYISGLVIYRLFLSPLAKFPGPKIAAMTSYYELYYDVIHKGKYIFQIEKMHDKYGPIVRINPFELSIRDSEYYDELYVMGNIRKTDRYEAFVEGVVDFEGSHLATISHDLHRKRRKPLDPYFSRQGITRLEPMVAELTEKLVVNRLESYKGTGKVVRLDHAFTAFSGDVINRICVNRPSEVYVEDEDFAPWWFDMFHLGAVSLPLFMGMPWLIRLIRFMPASLASYLNTSMGSFSKFKLMCDEQLNEAKREKALKSKSQNSNQPTPGRLTLFRHLVDSDLPPAELSDTRLSREAQVLIGSGTMTTAGTMGFLCYYIMINPKIRARLSEELGSVMAEYPAKKPSLAELERLPYLQAVIKEGLRLSYGTMHRRARVSPSQPLLFKEWVIPPGTPVGMSAYFQHRDEKTFPRPMEFLPERWLGEITPAMYRNYIPFSKGSRHCLGMNLAYCELNFILAAMFRPGAAPFELYGTDESDVRPVHDLIVPMPRLDSLGVRVVYN
ncbi:cytochrome P450 [Aspergillus undulatus]|uniref:Cytochrome P450 monooxygenase oblB n=1 Tax=Emericella variicolor TaxID=1549217 RepID=OBLB_EMEVA|nr:RecName: Full=Cytochrome P450 monooxygenase oblB; AltName: Full=Ophiobolin biosynthesis cluster protein B [Aspergillus stellatus]BAX09283.1 putative cytochrome P450 [Aspergillus stellatus]